MQSFLLIFEGLGTGEMLLVALVALILFGPRKLPEIGRKVGKAIGEFKRASDDFKRTWEYEVEIEKRTPAAEHALAFEGGASGDAAAALPAYDAGAADFDGSHSQAATPEPTVARGAAEEDEHAWDVATGRSMTRPADKDDELNAS